MKAFLTLWIMVCLIQEVIPSTLVRLPRHLTKQPSLVQTEYEAKYEQTGKHGNESSGVVSGKQEIVHDNCAENWNEFAEKCASLIKDLVASLAGAVSSKPGDATNLQLQIKNTFKHFDNTHNCTCFKRSGKKISEIDLSPLFNNISTSITDPNSNNCGTKCTDDIENEGKKASAVDPTKVFDKQTQQNRALFDVENFDVNPENVDGTKDQSTNNCRRQAKLPQNLEKKPEHPKKSGDFDPFAQHSTAKSENKASSIVSVKPPEPTEKPVSKPTKMYPVYWGDEAEPSGLPTVVKASTGSPKLTPKHLVKNNQAPDIKSGSESSKITEYNKPDQEFIKSKGYDLDETSGKAGSKPISSVKEPEKANAFKENPFLVIPEINSNSYLPESTEPDVSEPKYTDPSPNPTSKSRSTKAPKEASWSSDVIPGKELRNPISQETVATITDSTTDAKITEASIITDTTPSTDEDSTSTVKTYHSQTNEDPFIITTTSDCFTPDFSPTETSKSGDSTTDVPASIISTNDSQSTVDQTTNTPNTIVSSTCDPTTEASCTTDSTDAPTTVVLTSDIQNTDSSTITVSGTRDTKPEALSTTENTGASATAVSTASFQTTVSPTKIVSSTCDPTTEASSATDSTDISTKDVSSSCYPTSSTSDDTEDSAKVDSTTEAVTTTSFSTTCDPTTEASFVSSETSTTPIGIASSNYSPTSASSSSDDLTYSSSAVTTPVFVYPIETSTVVPTADSLVKTKPAVNVGHSDGEDAYTTDNASSYGPSAVLQKSSKTTPFYVFPIKSQTSPQVTSEAPATSFTKSSVTELKPAEPDLLLSTNEGLLSQDDQVPVSTQATTFQTISENPTESSKILISTTLAPDESDEKPSTSAKSTENPEDDDDDDDDEDCCSCESCTEEEILDPKQYKENACRDLEEARRELKAIFDKIKKKLKCGRKAPQSITAS